MKTLLFAFLLIGFFPEISHAEATPSPRLAACLDSLAALFQEAGVASDDQELANRIIQKRAQCDRLRGEAKAPKVAK